ncbi:MAG: 16S rRNA (cytidine(1402)-2'-O)-methyltransferase [Saccharofermentanales bacterium]
MAFFCHGWKGIEEMSEEIMNRELGEDSGDEVGTLYLVATPLGNREDMSPRAARILEQVAYVAAEDTRTAARLLSELGVGNRLISYYEQNQHARHEMFLRDLHAGRSIAVISEAGMPCISDPGEGIVRLAVEHSIPISVIPGPSAFVSAVAASGFDTRHFVYSGFIPARGRDRRMLIKEIAAERRTIVFYEAPHRIEKTFRDLVEADLGARRIVIARELTKRYEEFIRLTVAEAVAYYETVTPRGEFTIVLEGAAEYEARTGDRDARSDEELIELLRNCLDEGMTTREAAADVAAETGESKNKLYQLALSVKETR